MFHPKKMLLSPFRSLFKKKFVLTYFSSAFNHFMASLNKISTNYFLRLCLPIVSFCFYRPNYCPLITLAFFTTRVNNTLTIDKFSHSPKKYEPVLLVPKGLAIWYPHYTSLSQPNLKKNKAIFY